MRLALATLAAALALAPAAPAATVANGVPAAGPALAGAQVAWGERWRDGTLRIVRGGPRQVAATVAAADAPRTARRFVTAPWAFAASDGAFAALVYTGTTVPGGADSSGIATVNGVLGGAWAAPALLAGALPPRGDGPWDPATPVPRAVDADGARVAIAEHAGSDERIRIAGPDGERVVPVGAGDVRVESVQLAGRFLAWTLTPTAGQSLYVLDLDTGRTVFSTSAHQLHAAAIGDIALDDDGTVALTFAGPYRAPRLARARPGSRGVKVLAHDVADRGIAISGGWILYEQLVSGDRSQLSLRHVSGARPRRLAWFGPGHRRAGDVDLGMDGSRATWAVGGRAARIVVRTL